MEWRVLLWDVWTAGDDVYVDPRGKIFKQDFGFCLKSCFEESF